MLSRPSSLLDRRLPLHCGQSLHPAPASHRAGLCLTRHQRGFTQFTRPVFPSPAAARMERAAASAFPRASHPADQEPATHARVGTGQRARTWNYTLNITFGLILQSCSSLTTCDLASHGCLQQSRSNRCGYPTLLLSNGSRTLTRPQAESARRGCFRSGVSQTPEAIESSAFRPAAACWASGERLAPPGCRLALRRHCDSALPASARRKGIVAVADAARSRSVERNHATNRRGAAEIGRLRARRPSCKSLAGRDRTRSSASSR